jgi:hypothetical protein
MTRGIRLRPRLISTLRALGWLIICLAPSVAPAWASDVDRPTLPVSQRSDPNHKVRYGDRWIDLARGGRFEAEIVIGGDGTPASRHAAVELQRYLERIVGVPIPVVERLGAAPTSIVVGPGPLARSLGVDVQAFPRDAYVIRHVRHDGRDIIVIAGRDDGRWLPTTESTQGTGLQPFERATLFGTYDFLERFMGVRFFFGNEAGTVFPRAKTLRVPSMQIYEAPDFVMRRVSITRGRLPLESPRTRRELVRLVHHEINTLRYETFVIPTTHGLARTGLLERFGASHPEYFALRADGQRDLASAQDHPQLCLKNPGLRNEVLRDAVGYLDGHPASERGILRPDSAGGYDVGAFAPGYVSLMPMDGLAPKTFCRDELCRPWANDEGDYSDYVWEFVNFIARRLKAYGVRGHITNIAYAGYRQAPDFPIEDNVVVQLALVGPWKEVDAGQREDDALIAQWDEKIGGRGEVLLWNYMNSVNERAPDGTPALAPRHIASYYQRNAPHLAGAYLQSDTDYRLFNYLNYYVFHRVAWDVETDVEALLRDHHEKMFGPAAGPMGAFFDRLEEIWAKRGIVRYQAKTKPRVITPTLSETWGEIYGEDEIAALDALFDEAEALTSDSPEHRERVDYLRRNFLGEIQRGRRAYYDRQRMLEDLALEIPYAGEDPIRLDGRLDDPVWSRSEPFHLMVGPAGADPAVSTSVRAAFTRTHVILGFDSKENDLPGMRKRAAGNRVGLIVGDPLDVDGGGTRQIWVDSRGQVIDRREEGAMSAAQSWRSGSRGAALEQATGWTAELEIPLASLPRGRTPRGAPELVVNLARQRELGGKQPIEEWASWSPFVRRGPAEPDRFGRMRLVKRGMPSASLVTNGGMEELGGGRRLLAAWTIAKGAAVDRTTLREGRQSLRLEARDFSNVAIRQSLEGLRPNTRYALTFFVRTEGLEQRPGADYAGGYVNVMADRNFFFPYMRFAGRTPWSKHVYEFETGPEPKKGKPSYIALGLHQARGRIWFDDVRIQPVESAPSTNARR